MNENKKSENFFETSTEPKVRPNDFIGNLKKDILESMPEISPDWAESCATITLATVLFGARVIEKEAPLKLNLIELMVAPSGIGKSKVMYEWIFPIMRKVEKKINRNLILPSRFSVEGFIKYTSKKENGHYINDKGVIIRDEFSALFKGGRRKDWQADEFEFISELYDGTHQKRYTITHGEHSVPDVYVNILSATTPYFVAEMDKEFFIQGTGNRFLFTYFPIEEYKVPDLDSIDYFRHGWENYREQKFEDYSNKLASLHEQHGKIYLPKLKNIYVSEEAGKLWVEYKKKTENLWKRLGKDKTSWTHHPLKRYAEFALKLSAIYSVSRLIRAIPNMNKSFLEDFTIMEEDMVRAIYRVQRHYEDWKQIVRLKSKMVPQAPVKSLEDQAKIIVLCLAEAPNKMLNVEQWCRIQAVTANPNKFYKLKDIAEAKGWVRQVKRSEVKSLEEIRRLKLDQPRTKVYTPTEKIAF